MRKTMFKHINFAIVALCFPLSLLAQSYTPKDNYELVWENYRTANGVWPEGSVEETLKVGTASGDTTSVAFKINGPTAALVLKNEASGNVPYDQPSVTVAYAGRNALVYAVEGTEWPNPNSILTTVATFSEPVTNLSFSAYDIDANTATDVGVDRSEILGVVGFDLDGNRVFPTLTTSSANQMASGWVNNNAAEGVIQASPFTTNGDVLYDFGTQLVTKINLYFKIQGMFDANGTNLASVNTEPGFALGNLTYSTVQILPMKLLSFEAAAVDSGTVLTWVSLDEKYMSHFELERSYDGVHFEQVAKVNAIGMLASQTAYTMKDYKLKKNRGMVYYRLKQVDMDGSFSYSSIKQVALLKQSLSVKLYPNPIKLGGSITVQSDRGIDNIRMYTMQGALVNELKGLDGEHTVQLSGEGLALGAYIIVLNGSEKLLLTIVQ